MLTPKFWAERDPAYELGLGRSAEDARRRAVTLVRDSRRKGRVLEREFETALFASCVAHGLGDRDEATEMGAIAAEALTRAEARPEGLTEEEVGLADLLEHQRDALGLASWPKPANR